MRPDDGLPIPDLEDTAALPANLVYSAGAIETFSAWAPGHALLMRDDAGGDIRYPDADERERGRYDHECAEWICTHGTRLTLRCGQCERERVLAEELARERREAELSAAVERVAAMSHDFGSIAEGPASVSERRLAYELTSEGTKDAISQKLGDLLTEYYRYGPGGYKGGAEAAIEAAVNIVLDTVSA